MKLGFDIDEVVCLLSEKIAEDTVTKFGTSYENAKAMVDGFIKDYNFKINNVHNEANEITKFFLYEAYNANTLLSAPFDKEGQYAIRQFKHSGHSIHFITSRDKKFKDLTVNWMRKNKIVFDSVDFVGHNGEKGIVARALNLDFFLDDLETSLESLYKYKKRWRKGLCLLDKPWNGDYIDGSRFKRLHNWTEVKRHLGIQNR